MMTMTATQARQNLFQILRKSIKGHVPIKITSRVGDVVMISQGDYEGLLETLELLSSPGLLKSVREAKDNIAKRRTKTMKEIFGK